MENAVWEANRGFLYDVFLMYALEWPSLTVDWLPGYTVSDDETEIHQLICATHTSCQEKEYLMLMEIHIPCKDEIIDHHSRALDCFPTFFLVPGSNSGHGIQRARHNNQIPTIVGCTTDHPEVFIYDLSSLPKPDGLKYRQKYVDKLSYVGVGQKTGGFTLDWNPHADLELITGTEDGGIYSYDFKSPISGNIPSYLQGSKSVGAHFNDTWCHSPHHAVNDVSWSHEASGNIFGSAADDGCVCLWDKRSSGCSNRFVAKNLQGENVEEVRCLTFSPIDEHLFATGSDAGLARVWDCRMQKASLLAFHHDSRRLNNTEANFSNTVVTELSWVPQSPSLLMTTIAYDGKNNQKKGKDVRLSEQCVWDLSCADQPEDSDPLLFVHRNTNHSEIIDTSMSATSMLVANVDSDNMLGIWRMADELMN